MPGAYDFSGSLFSSVGGPRGCYSYSSPLFASVLCVEIGMPGACLQGANAQRKIIWRTKSAQFREEPLFSGGNEAKGF
jgi:hypothetical protein